MRALVHIFVILSKMAAEPAEVLETAASSANDKVAGSTFEFLSLERSSSKMYM